MESPEEAKSAPTKLPSDRWRKIVDLFDGAMAVPKPERAAWVDGQCGPDRTIWSEVDSLIKASEDEERAFTNASRRPGIAGP